MYTLESLLKEGIGILEASGIEEARLDAWLLLEYAAGKDRAYFYAHPEEPVRPETSGRYLALCRERAARVPLQHLTGQAHFMGHVFRVNRHVLIPRQDTETLAEEGLRLLRDVREPFILDMCTGSGCILLSLLLERPDSRGVGADLSPEALRVAEENARLLGVGERALFVQSDLFSGEYFHEKDGKYQGRYDMLIANPPYIPTAEIEGLMEEVRLHDPFMALDGKADGLCFYRRITAEAARYIKPGGYLLYEIGRRQGRDVSGLMRRAGFEDIAVKRDLAGLDRVVLGRRP